LPKEILKTQLTEKKRCVQLLYNLSFFRLSVQNIVSANTLAPGPEVLQVLVMLQVVEVLQMMVVVISAVVFAHLDKICSNALRQFFFFVGINSSSNRIAKSSSFAEAGVNDGGGNSNGDVRVDGGGGNGGDDGLVSRGGVSTTGGNCDVDGGDNPVRGVSQVNSYLVRLPDDFVG
jgi:hypothetical protein